MAEKKITDRDLGTITLRWGTRYKRITLKIVRGELIGTMPSLRDEPRIMGFIEENRLKLTTKLQQTPPPAIIDENTDLQTASFRLSILREERKDIALSLQNGLLTLRFPAHIDMAQPPIQQQIREILKNIFRREAKRLLPIRLSLLAGQHGFTYNNLRITSSHTRWGSCSSGKNINLSLYLMQLPWHLIDYVLLHELCHTREMNHSPRFWALMDSVTDNKAKALRAELKKHSIYYPTEG